MISAARLSKKLGGGSFSGLKRNNDFRKIYGNICEKMKELR